LFKRSTRKDQQKIRKKVKIPLTFPAAQVYWPQFLKGERMFFIKTARSVFKMKMKPAFVLTVLLAFSFVPLTGYAQTYDKANPPANVTASFVEEYGGIIIINWTAAENATDYTVFYQAEGSKVIRILTSRDYAWAYPDKYESAIPGDNFRDLFTSGGLDKKWRFGVRTNNKLDSGGRTSGPSDIVWTPYIAVR
jgi:hypothetical protein